MDNPDPTPSDADGDPATILLQEHSRMANLTVKAVDLIEVAQSRIIAGQHVNIPAVKKVTAQVLRQSVARRDQALRDLGLTDEQIAAEEPVETFTT